MAGIFQDAVAFFRILDKVRAGNPRGKDGHDLNGQFPVTYRMQPARDSQTPSRFFARWCWGVRRWSGVGLSIRCRFLVWGEKWEDLPDRHFFVDAGPVFEGRNEILQQLGR
jgi:hypothetical protein